MVVECCVINNYKTLVLVLQKIWRVNIFANTWDITFICDPMLLKFGMAVKIKLINYFGQVVFVQIYIRLIGFWYTNKNERDLFCFQVYERGIYEYKLHK